MHSKTGRHCPSAKRLTSSNVLQLQCTFSIMYVSLCYKVAPTLPPNQVPAALLQHALHYVEWVEDQKTIFIDVNETRSLQLKLRIYCPLCIFVHGVSGRSGFITRLHKMSEGSIDGKHYTLQVYIKRQFLCTCCIVNLLSENHRLA